MQIDQNKILNIFIEETTELLQGLENDIIALEDNISPNIVNKVFRSFHTIKGSANIVGIEKLSRLTHLAENFLVKVREGKLKPYPNLITALLKSVDVLNDMVYSLIKKEPVNEAPFDDAIRMLENLKTGEETIQTTDEKEEMSEEPQSDEHYYFIKLKFSETVMTAHGINPLIFLKQINNSGTIDYTHLIIEDIPDREHFDPLTAYMYWQLLLRSEMDYGDIESLLIFVIEDNPIEIAEFNREEYIKKLKENGISFNDILASQKSDTSAEEEKGITEVIEGKSETVQEEASAPDEAAQTEEQTQISFDTNHKEQRIQYLKIGTDKIDSIFNLVEEMVISQARVIQLGNAVSSYVQEKQRMLERVLSSIDDSSIRMELQSLSTQEDFSNNFQRALTELERISRDIQKEIMSVRMTPIGPTLNQFYRVIRDITSEGRKRIKLSIIGEDTELDKSMIDKIGNPLKHLVRNAVDHGIETIQERKEAGKYEEGHVIIKAYHKEGHIFIEICDDGKGLDSEVILQKAIEKELIPVDVKLTDEEILKLIFLPGLSTAKQVTDISGRGVGMDVVYTEIQKLKGEVYISTEKGKGSTFTIRLPLTLAIIDGMLIKVAGNILIIPVLSIVETLSLFHSKVKTVEGQAKVIHFRGEYIPLISLKHVLGFEDEAVSTNSGKTNEESAENESFTYTAKSKSNIIVVVVEVDNKKYGLLIDELLYKQQIVIKSLETNYRNIDGLTGATILGDGNVALILDIAGIVKIFDKAEKIKG